MAYIGFLLIMIGLAATGEAIDGRGDMVCAVAMTVGGAWLMWLNREEDEEGEDSEEENCAANLSGSSPMDKPVGESGRGCEEDLQR